ncbi:hypothetical protein N825_33555 [Skermanella stibiiresistens SB22]|uniref:Uncharacterized protein n=1 Tax=Skermanella stibiiresistens SB22 TaxID=1385369 RepID=W9H484_9PROT|nr:hypothetical protein N825_33555 [Skermanella stibiiresistens SB22]
MIVEFGQTLMIGSLPQGYIKKEALNRDWTGRRATSLTTPFTW